MATPFGDTLFWLAATAIALSQLMILRSTWRAQRTAAAAGRASHRVSEWLYALLPAVALVALLVFTWQAMHPAEISFRGIAFPEKVR